MRTVVGEVAIEYLQKYKGRPNLQIARLLYSEQPELFSSVEAARNVIRYYTGAKGKKKYAISDLVNHNKNWMDFLKLPEGDSNDIEPYVLPKSSKKIGVLSDIHIPYHSRSALQTALEWLDKHGIDTLILNGDTLDAYQLSRFCKDPREKKFHEELEMCRGFLDGLSEAGWLIIWKDGNHDERYYHYMMQKAPELLDIPQFEFPALMQFGAKNIKYVTNKTLIKAGHLKIAHGHEFGGGAGGVNPARTFYLKTHDNVIGGHFHRTSEHSEQNLSGKLYSCWSTGCLSDLHPKYMPYNKWNHGFAMVETDGEQFEVYNKKILKGKVY